MSPDTEDARARVLGLLKRHGWNATSFQTLESHFHYGFDGEDGCVAYVDTGEAWVAAGAPIASEAMLPQVAQRFVTAAREKGRRVCFFGTEERFVRAVPFRALLLGEQPTWNPATWADAVQATPSLREQLRRARAKGVRVRALNPSELARGEGRLRTGLEALIQRWLQARPLPPMQFLVKLEPFSFPEEKRCFVAERAGHPVAFLAVVPVYQRRGWFLEDLLRDPQAPNGTVELLIDHAMRAAHEAGSTYATLGLVPLSGPLGLPLRMARSMSRNLYDFEGLRRFKAKLRPDGWSPVFLSVPAGEQTHLALLDVLRAFAGGSLLRFGGQALLRVLFPPFQYSRM